MSPIKLSAKIEREIIDLYRNNVSYREITHKLNVSSSTIANILYRNNVSLKNRKRISENKENEVIDLYKEGHSIKHIIDQTGVRSEQTIYRILNESGVKKRRKQ